MLETAVFREQNENTVHDSSQYRQPVPRGHVGLQLWLLRNSAQHATARSPTGRQTDVNLNASAE
jgi:hypothetical protein